MANSKTDAAGINTDSIIKPTIEELSEEQLQGLDAWRKHHKEEFEALQRNKDEADEELYVSSFKKDRQGVIAPIKDPKFVPLNIDIDQPSVSKNHFSSEQISEIQYYVSQGTNNVY